MEWTNKWKKLVTKKKKQFEVSNPNTNIILNYSYKNTIFNKFNFTN